MTSPLHPRKIPSTGPRPQLVCHAGARLVIEALLPDHEHRPFAIDLPSLQRFCTLMADAGWSALLSRMAFDPIYARDRLTFAQRNGDRTLRLLASSLMTRHLRHGSAAPRS